MWRTVAVLLVVALPLVFLVAGCNPGSNEGPAGAPPVPQLKTGGTGTGATPGAAPVKAKKGPTVSGTVESLTKDASGAVTGFALRRGGIHLSKNRNDTITVTPETTYAVGKGAGTAADLVEKAKVVVTLDAKLKNNGGTAVAISIKPAKGAKGAADKNAAPASAPADNAAAADKGGAPAKAGSATKTPG